MSSAVQSAGAVRHADQQLVDAFHRARTPEQRWQIVGALAVLRRGDAG